MEMRSAYQQNLNSQLKEWDVLIKILSAKVENASADVRLMYAHEIDSIRRRQGEVAKRIKELEDANDETWERVKVTVDKVGCMLGTGIAKAITTFR